MGSAIRASGRKRANGRDKGLIRLERRQADFERLDVSTKAERTRPGSRNWHSRTA